MITSPSKLSTLSTLAIIAGALSFPEISLAQATVTWGPAQDTAGPSDVASGGAVVEALNGLVYVPYLSDNPAEDVTIAGVLFDATNYLGKDFPNEPPGSFIANHTSGDAAYDALIANLSGCDGATLGNGSTDDVANYQITGLTVGENYLIQVWYTDVRGISDARAVTLDGSVTLESGINADPIDLGQFAIGTFTATATTQILNIDTMGTAGRATASAILVRVDDGSSGNLGTSYCGPAVVNASGAPAVISAAGTNNTASNDVTLTVNSMPTFAFGFFITSQTTGFAANPGGSAGNLCLGGSIGRYVGPGQILNSGALGTISLQLDLTNTPQPTGSVSVAAGETWNYQAWFRDIDGSGSPTSNFTDGLAITFL